MVDHQTIVAAKPIAPLATVGYKNVLVYCSNRVVYAGCSRSLNGGITWITGGPALSGFDSNNNLCSSITGHLAADPDGRLFLPAANCGYPQLAISNDSGTSWAAIKVSDMKSPVEHTSIASDNAGNLYYVWIDAQQIGGPKLRG